jgi:hypothetical protein
MGPFGAGEVCAKAIFARHMAANQGRKSSCRIQDGCVILSKIKQPVPRLARMVISD